MINNIKISGLPELISPTTSGYTVIAEGNTTYKISLQSLFSNIGALTLTTTGSTGPANYDSVLNVLNIPIYETESVSGVYFVDKRYEGVACAVVTGFTACRYRAVYCLLRRLWRLRLRLRLRRL